MENSQKKNEPPQKISADDIIIDKEMGIAVTREQFQEILQSIDTEDLIEMIGEDTLLSEITDEKISSFWKFSELLDMYENGDIITALEDDIEDIVSDNPDLCEKLVEKVFDKDEWFNEEAERREMITMDCAVEYVSVQDVVDEYGVKEALSYIDLSDAVDYYGIPKILNEIGEDECVDHFNLHISPEDDEL